MCRFNNSWIQGSVKRTALVQGWCLQMCFLNKAEDLPESSMKFSLSGTGA